MSSHVAVRKDPDLVPAPTSKGEAFHLLEQCCWCLSPPSLVLSLSRKLKKKQAGRANQQCVKGAGLQRRHVAVQENQEHVPVPPAAGEAGVAGSVSPPCLTFPLNSSLS